MGKTKQTRNTVPENILNKLLSIEIENNKMLKKLVSEKEKELLTAAEVCKMLKISKDTFHEYANDKLFQLIQLKPKGRLYVQRSEIEMLIERGKV